MLANASYQVGFRHPNSVLNRNAVRALVFCSTDCGDSSVGCHNEHWSHGVLEGAVQECEAFNVEHVDLIDEQNTRHDICLAFFAPLCNFGINLVSHLGLDFTGVSREQCQKPLRPTIDDIDFMQTDTARQILDGYSQRFKWTQNTPDSVNNLLPLLELAFRTRYKFSLRAGCVVVSRTGE